MTRVVGIRDTIQDYCLNQFYYCCIVKLAYLLPNTHTTRILMISLKKKIFWSNLEKYAWETLLVDGQSLDCEIDWRSLDWHCLDVWVYTLGSSIWESAILSYLLVVAHYIDTNWKGGIAALGIPLHRIVRAAGDCIRDRAPLIEANTVFGGDRKPN